jgi:hypothetical protein
VFVSFRLLLPMPKIAAFPEFTRVLLL